ncbi:MAG: ABC transporter permease [Planctomycetota bacterium]|nr:MAG: ABC transporter permease [Planctomycetota bacterium]
MVSYIVRKLFWAIPTLLGVSLLVFLMVHFIPGDPVLALTPKGATEEYRRQLRRELGLDRPLYEQYFRFIGRAIRGDFGRSVQSSRPVMEEFWQRFPATLELSLVSMFLAVLLGVGVGIISAVWRNTWLDYLSMTGALAGVSMPVFWLGLVLIYFFSFKLGWFPVSGRISSYVLLELPEPVTGLLMVDTLLVGDMEAFRSALSHLVLPSLALSTIPMAIIARMTRASMLEVLQAEYIKTARAKGCSSWRVIFVHALRNALIPVVTVIGLMLGSLLAGAVLTETTFSWPGVGKWVVDAVQQRDYPVIQAATLMISCIFILLNLGVDVLYAWIHPEIRYT